jgi:pyruvate carboxylase subunit B
MRPVRVTLLSDIDLVMPAAETGDEELSLRKDDPATGPEIRAIDTPTGERAAGQRLYEVTVNVWNLRYRVEDEERAALLERARRGGAAAKTHVREHVRARIPGRVTRVWVEPGQHVAAGEHLLALEAMKMENEVRAPRAGTVVAVHVQPGQPVELNSELVTLD